MAAIDVLQEYTVSLQRQAAAEADHANSSTISAAAAAANEFIAWAQPRFAARGVTMLTCSPEDIVVYFESHWLPRHGATVLGDGQLHAAPSYLSSTLSHLSGVFKRLGRDGPYDHSRQAGNPCLHSSITALRTTHSRQMWHNGYAVRSATSLEFSKYRQMMLQLNNRADQQVASLAATARSGAVGPYRFSAGKAAMLTVRDQLAFGLCWEAAVRAQNAGWLDGDEVQDRRGQSLLPQLLQKDFPFAAGYEWQLAPNGTKVQQQRRAGCLPMTVRPVEERHLDPLRILHTLLTLYSFAGVPTDSFLLRPLAENGQSFKDEPLSTDNINKRLQGHLQKLQLHHGESTHSLRRGTVIHDTAVLGRSASQAGQRLQHAQPGGPQTLQYLDTSRESGPPRSRQRRM